MWENDDLRARRLKRESHNKTETSCGNFDKRAQVFEAVSGGLYCNKLRSSNTRRATRKHSNDTGTPQ